MEPFKTINLTVEDYAWLSVKMNSHYTNIKKSDALTDEEKQVEIDILMQRASRFGMQDLIGRMGYLVYKIRLENDREAELILPRNADLNDLKILKKHLYAQFNMKPDEPEDEVDLLNKVPIKYRNENWILDYQNAAKNQIK